MAIIGIVPISEVYKNDRTYLHAEAYLSNPKKARKKLRDAEIALKRAETALANAKKHVEEEKNRERRGVIILVESDRK